MPRRPSPCPVLDERPSDPATVRNCPRCGRPPVRQETEAISAEDLKPSKTRRSSPMAIAAIVSLAVIVGVGPVGCRKDTTPSPPITATAKVETANLPAAPEATPTKSKMEEVKDEGPAWCHNTLVVVRPDQGVDKRPVVILGHPTGMIEEGQFRGAQNGLLRAS